MLPITTSMTLGSVPQRSVSDGITFNSPVLSFPETINLGWVTGQSMALSSDRVASSVCAMSRAFSNVRRCYS